MFKRLASIAAGSGDLVQAEGDLIFTKLKRLGVYGALLLLAAFTVLVGVIALAVAGVMALAGAVGWPIAIVVIAGALLACGVGIGLWARARMRDALRRETAPVEVRQRIREAKTMIYDNDHHTPSADQPTHKTTKDKIARAIYENPGLTAGAALIAVGLFGPARLLRLTSRGLMLAGLASSVKRQFDDHRDEAQQDQPTHPWDERDRSPQLARME